jgi:hypothetical protein
MANTSVSICSNALIKLGDDPITSLTDNTVRARHCNRLFTPTRQAVLRDAVWTDSRKRARLAQLSEEPAWPEYAYMYALPADYMRMVKTSLDEYGTPYVIEGRTLLTDEAEVYILYIYDNEDVASYDAGHVDALTARMAFELAEPITGKKSSGDKAAAEYEVKKRDAKAVDGQEDAQDIYTDSTLTNIRY